MNNRDELIDQIMCMYFEGIPLEKALTMVKGKIKEDAARKRRLDKDFKLMFKNWSEDN